jgi:DNA-binding transcriptional LysR family regulator
MEHRQLKTFVTVARELSFTRAAGELGYVQSAVTAQVKALEKELGVPLFDRLGRSVVLTEAGKDLLGYAVRMLDLLEEARVAVSQGNGDGVYGTLEVGASETLCVYRLPSLFRVFRARYPGVDLRFRPVPYPNLKNLVREGRLDVAFLLEEPVEERWLEAETFVREPLVLVGSPDHALAKRSRMSLADLAGEPMLLTDPGCSYRRAFEREMAKAGVEPGKILEFDSVEAIKRCTVAGLGVSILPEVTVRGELERGELVALRQKDVKMTVDTQAVRHGSRWLSPALRAFLETSREVLRSVR